MWLRDFLPQDLQNDGLKVRVMVFNHNTRWETNTLSKSLEDYAQDLLREVGEKRRSKEVSNCLSCEKKRKKVNCIESSHSTGENPSHFIHWAQLWRHHYQESQS